MGAVHGRQVGAVLIAKLDRCTCSVADLASLIDTFSRRGVALISAAESLDTSSAGGRLVVNVLGAVAQWEREATAERTSAALQVLKQQGRATGGVAPYGFQFIDGRRAWHQGEQETLAAIIEHRRAGLSWAKVADKLSATGHRTRTGGQWTRQGAYFQHGEELRLNTEALRMQQMELQRQVEETAHLVEAANRQALAAQQDLQHRQEREAREAEPEFILGTGSFSSGQATIDLQNRGGEARDVSLHYDGPYQFKFRPRPYIESNGRANLSFTSRGNQPLDYPIRFRITSTDRLSHRHNPGFRIFSGPRTCEGMIPGRAPGSSKTWLNGN